MPSVRTQNPAADARLRRGGLPGLPGAVPAPLRRVLSRNRDGGVVRPPRGRVHGGEGADEDHQLPGRFQADPEGHRAGVHQERQQSVGERERERDGGAGGRGCACTVLAARSLLACCTSL